MSRRLPARVASAATFLALVAACGGGNGGGGGGGGGGGPPAADWYVSATGGSDGGAGSVGSPFQTLTHALSVASLGQTVYAYPGVYDAVNGETFPIAVPPGVTLLGDEPNKGIGVVPTVIQGGGVVPPPNGSGHIFAAVSPGSGSSVAGFCITDDVTFGADYPFGVVLQNGSVTLRNDTVQNCNWAGVYCYNAAGSHLILGNVIRNNTASDGLAFISGGLGSRVEGNVITGNAYGVEFDAAGGDLGGGATGSLGGNTISCNSASDLWTNAAITIDAQNCLWDHVAPTVSTVGAGGGVDIFNGGGGATINLTGALLAGAPCP